MLVNGKNESHGLYYYGCSCCNSKRVRRKVKHSIKYKDRMKWKKDSMDY